MTTTKQNQTAVREVNRMLLQTVRTDWRFPNPPKTTADHAGDPVTYRERFYSTSDDSSSSDADIGEEVEEDEASEEEDPELVDGTVRFESPDSVAHYIDRKIQARKRKKKRLFEEEMGWNTGLCYFMRRRNAWTGAVSPDSVKEVEEVEEVEEEQGPLKPPPSDIPASEDLEKKEPNSAENESPTDAEVSPYAPESPQELESIRVAADSDSGIVMASPSSETALPETTPYDPPADSSALTTILIPIPQPLLAATHPVRYSIMSRSTSELYEKVVRDSRTPAVPINLAHMMRVIVQGWKDEGNWPPKGSIVQSINLGDTASVGKDGKAGAILGGGHRHLRQGMESVKRVLRLSGSAPPRGD